MNEKREALVGLVLVAAVALTVFGTLWLQGTMVRGDTRDLMAVFDGVGQIRDGNPVKLRGVQIGRVREIAVEPDGTGVRVHFRVSDDVTLPPDPVVVLSPESMFGDWQAEIHPRGRFPHATYTEPDAPDVLPGYALPDISQLTAAADRISENLGVLTDRVGIAFSDETARNIASLIENVEDVTERLAALVTQQASEFAGVTDDIGSATRSFGEASVEARNTFARLDELLGRTEVETSVVGLAEIVENLRVLTGDLGETNIRVQGTAVRADSTLARVERLASAAERGEGSLGRLLSDPTMAAEAEATLEALRALLLDIQENPRRYLRLSIF